MKAFVLLLTSVATGLLLSGCGAKPSAAGARASGGVQVVVVPARLQPVDEIISPVGSLAADEMVEITSETDGVVLEVLFREGQAVEKGQQLLQLEESKFAAALAEAEANFKLSQASFDRAKQLLADRLVSQQEFDQAAAAFEFNRASVDLRRRQLKDSRIYAPFAGVVGARRVSPGRVIGKNEVITTLVDLDPVKVEVNVPERYLSQLKVGQELDLTVAAFPGRKFHGRVFFVSPFVDPDTRTALVKAAIPNPTAELKPGMFANLNLTLARRESAIVIPEPAVLLSGDRVMVFTVSPTNTAVMRPVKLGVRLAGIVEVVEGLKAGDSVIIEGLQKLYPGAPVTLAPPEKAAAYQSPAGAPAGDKPRLRP